MQLGDLNKLKYEKLFQYKWFTVYTLTEGNGTIEAYTTDMYDKSLTAIKPAIDASIKFLESLGFTPIPTALILCNLSKLHNPNTDERDVGGFAYNTQIFIDAKISKIKELTDFIIHEWLHVWFFKVDYSSRSKLETVLNNFKTLLFRDRKQHIDLLFGDVINEYSKMSEQALTKLVKRVSARVDSKDYATTIKTVADTKTKKKKQITENVSYPVYVNIKRELILGIVNALKKCTKVHFKGFNIKLPTEEVYLTKIAAELVNLSGVNTKKDIISIPTLYVSMLQSIKNDILRTPFGFTPRNSFPSTTTYIKLMYNTLNEDIELKNLPSNVLYKYLSILNSSKKISPYGLSNVDEFWVDIVLNYDNLGVKYQNIIKDIISKYK